jgi:TrmH family RNA methyltransferase
MKIISSAENVKFKEILNLVRSNKSRARTGLTLLDGIHLIDGYLKNVGLPKMI